MAEFRSIHCKTWRDDWFSELPTDAKLLWLYLITNQSTSVSGIYQLPRKFMAFETGLEVSRVSQILDMFKSDGKIDFDDSVIWVKKMREYQSSGSEKVQTRIMSDFNSLPNCRVKGIYAQKYHIDMVSVVYPELSSDTDTDTETDTDTDTETDTDTPKAAKPPAVELNELQRKMLDSFNAKRFKNHVQRDAILSWSQYPIENVNAAITWAATKGFGLGDAVDKIGKALPNWNKPKPPNGKNDSTGNPMLDAIRRAQQEPGYYDDK